MNDLKLLDELMCQFKQLELCNTWKEVEEYSNINREVMERLRRAWRSREMESITMSLSHYFAGVVS